MLVYPEFEGDICDGVGESLDRGPAPGGSISRVKFLRQRQRRLPNSGVRAIVDLLAGWTGSARGEKPSSTCSLTVQSSSTRHAYR